MILAAPKLHRMTQDTAEERKEMELAKAR